MNLAHAEQFIIGIGYSDGYFGEITRPQLWKHWDFDERLSYTKARYYGGYVARQGSIRKLVGLQGQLVEQSIRLLIGGLWIRTPSEKGPSPTGR